MFIPRRTQLAEANPLHCFHLWSPVQPGLAALGNATMRRWTGQLLKRLCRAYAVELQGFSLAADQFHLVLRWTPQAAFQWSPDELSRRWRIAHPPYRAPAPEPGMPAGDTFTEVQPPGDAARKLASLSGFLQQFKQLITFQFNRQTKHKGTIWKGRFRLKALADASALAGVLAFIDLLPAAHGDGARPEESPSSSLHARVAQYKGKFGHAPMGSLDQPGGEWEPLPADVAQELREGADPWPEVAPPAMPENTMIPTPPMPDIPMNGTTPPPMPAIDMPGMEMPPAMMMPAMGGGTPMPGPMPETTAMPDNSGATPMAGPSPAGAGFWLLALRDDEPIPGVDAPPNAAPRGLLAHLPLRKYLQLLDTLLAKAKAWPHLPADAPGRTRAPVTPAWEGRVDALLTGLGLDAGRFRGQWVRMAGLRV